MDEQQVHPRNPSRAKTTNIPKKPGHTRTQAGRLEYEDPMDNTWKPAVHLETIRARLIQEAPPNSYTYAKQRGYDATDVTTFLAKDQPYGSDRNNRDPLVFQITSNCIRGQRPTGYLKDGGLVVLDAFNHGIRDFPLILPKCLSTNLGGYDIMNYFRQNQYITLYDLIARMPSGYHEKDGQRKVTWHNGSPRYGTVGMRATRFRLQAGLLTWKRRMGSDAKNAKILSLIPANCKDPRVNSTASHRDFTEAEQQAVRMILVGTAPNRARYANINDKQTNMNEDDGIEGDGETTIDEVDESNEDEPHNNFPGLQGQGVRSILFEDNGGLAPSAQRFRNGTNILKESIEKDSNAQHIYKSKVGPGRSQVTSSLSNDIPRPYPWLSRKPSGAPLPVLGSFDHPIQVHEQPDRRGRDEISKNSVDSSDSGEPIAKRRRAAYPIHGERSTKSHASIDLDGPTLVDARTEPKDNRNADPGAQVKTCGKDMKELDSLEAEAREPQSSLSSNRGTYTFSMKPVTAAASVNGTASAPASTEREQMMSHLLEHWKSPIEVDASTEPEDYRDANPTADADMKAIRQALELTREDFRQKTGRNVPAILATKYKDESYNAQHSRLQELFSKAGTEIRPIPQLYRLPAWNAGFANWWIPDQEGMDLYSNVLE